MRFKANIDPKLKKIIKQAKTTKKIKTLLYIHTNMNIQRIKIETYSKITKGGQRERRESMEK